MVSLITNYYTALNPIVLISAYIPLLAALAVWIAFYIRFDRGILKKLRWTLIRITNSTADFTQCRLDNLKSMNELAEDITTPQFKAAWNKMMTQVEQRYTQEIIPEAECFFRQDVLITVPAHRSSVKTIWGVSAALLLLSLMLPQILEMLIEQHGPSASAAGIIPAAFIVIVQLIFTALDNAVINKTTDAYHGFLYAFDSVLPTAAEMAGPALLLDATRKNQHSYEQATNELKESFTKSTETISSAIDTFANGGVLPAIRETMQTLTNDFIIPSNNEIRDKLNHALRLIMEKQETGMRELADGFAARLADTLEHRIHSLADSLEKYENHLEEQNTIFQMRMEEQNAQYQAQMTEQNALHKARMEEQNNLYQTRMEEQNSLHQTRVTEQNTTHESRMEAQNTAHQARIDELNSLLSQNMQNLDLYIEKQNQTMERTEQILGQAASLYQTEKENTSKFNENLDSLHQITERFRGQAEKFAEDTVSYSERSLESQQKFSTIVSEITSNMQEAMAGAGREIAQGINQAVEANAQAITDLTVQADALRSDYETFFNRSDESAKQTLEEMDYQIQGLITRMSEDIGMIMKAAIDKNGEILSQYKDQTTDLLQSFDEQSRSIGLYAKEINMDITELSANLNSSVSEFTEKIKEGIQISISEFDSGLAELTSRISNTVESIADAVENLPASIRGGNIGRE